MSLINFYNGKPSQPLGVFLNNFESKIFEQSFLLFSLYPTPEPREDCISLRIRISQAQPKETDMGEVCQLEDCYTEPLEWPPLSDQKLLALLKQQFNREGCLPNEISMSLESILQQSLESKVVQNFLEEYRKSYIENLKKTKAAKLREKLSQLFNQKVFLSNPNPITLHSLEIKILSQYSQSKANSEATLRQDFTKPDSDSSSSSDED